MADCASSVGGWAGLSQVATGADSGKKKKKRIARVREMDWMD